MFLGLSDLESLPGLVSQAGYHHLTHRKTEAGSETKHRILVLLQLLSLTSSGTSPEPWPLPRPQSLSSQNQGRREEAQKRAGRLLCLPKVTERERETKRERETETEREAERQREAEAERETERGIERGRERCEEEQESGEGEESSANTWGPEGGGQLEDVMAMIHLGRAGAGYGDRSQELGRSG